MNTFHENFSIIKTSQFSPIVCYILFGIFYCFSCAKIWRKKQLVDEEAARLKEEKDIDLRYREVLLKEKQLEMEKQKITIKETLPGTGNIIELTCYYDQHSRAKVTELLAGKWFYKKPLFLF